MKTGKTQRLVTIALLSAIAIILLQFLHFPLLPAAPYLEYDAMDIPILIGGFMFGPARGYGDHIFNGIDPRDHSQRCQRYLRYIDALYCNEHICAYGIIDLPQKENCFKTYCWIDFRYTCDDIDHDPCEFSGNASILGLSCFGSRAVDLTGYHTV